MWHDLFVLRWQVKGVSQTICTHAKAICMPCPLLDACQHGGKNLSTLKAFLDKPRLEDVSVRTPIGHVEADLCLKGGLQHGVLHEVFAAIGHETAATGFVAGLAARVAADKHLLWIRQDYSAHEFGELSPTGLLELGLDPTQMLLLCVTNASDGLRAANDALSCAALGAVVVEIPGRPKMLDLVASRRLTLAAAQKSVTTFVLRLNAQPDTSTAETRWLVRAAASQTQNEDWGYPTFEVSLVRNRHGKTGHWFMEWNCDECVFQSSAADHRAVVSATVN
jgi:protein ImuA